jgi:predicted glutamine amidotransferase
MLAIVARRPLSAAETIGTGALSEFAGLARLHADGWGTAWYDETGTAHASTSIEPLSGLAELDLATRQPSRVRLVYLRFASRGAPAAPGNSQPFLRDGMAFQHNGALTPREPALSLLDPATTRGLVGTTDSEVYFALVRRGLENAPPGTGALEATIETARILREHYPSACLNALVLVDDAVIVVQSSGGSGAPLGAFADRGHQLDDLPPGHGAGYNRLRLVTPASGVLVVSTTGTAALGGTDLPEDTVSRITPDGITTFALN